MTDPTIRSGGRTMKPLPTVRAALLAEPERGNEPWLIEGLWMREAVGIIGGEPKCGKSFLALDLAVAVAACTACLRRFPARLTGPVLLYAAEDAAPIVRQRFEGIAHAAGVNFHALDVHVITVPMLRLDRSDHCKALRATVADLRPRLLVLDPFVRLHAIDENVAGEVAPLLGFLRSLQRNHRTAVALVHHARKGAGHERGGQALRGSSELHAWGDSNLYLRRQGENLYLAIEHRAAPGIDRLQLTLRADPPSLALAVVENNTTQSCDRVQPNALQRIEQILAQSVAPLTHRQLRDAARMRASHVSDILAKLLTAGRVSRSAEGYCLNP
jgi:AAA domain